jgi:hypothetical protein
MPHSNPKVNRKREFLRRLKENLANDDPAQKDRVVDEFRALILGRPSRARQAFVTPASTS